MQEKQVYQCLVPSSANPTLQELFKYSPRALTAYYTYHFCGAFFYMVILFPKHFEIHRDVANFNLLSITCITEKDWSVIAHSKSLPSICG